MRPPEFWAHTEGKLAAPVIRALLNPVGGLYAWAGARRIASTTPERVGKPVICIGNITLGGAGKTPLTRTIRAMLKQLGATPATVSRGHGGRERGPLLVDVARHSAADVGDEPLLHAMDGPALIARDRAAGAKAAIAAGANVIVLDDGCQNPGLHKDVSIVVFDGGYGLGNGRICPAGPLREPLAAGLARADAVIVIWGGPDGGARPDYLRDFNGPVLDGWLEPAAPGPDGPVLAFAGIARPEKFFATLEQIGAQMVDGAAYPDHHPFTDKELTWLAQMAKDNNARLITTEKDAARLSPTWRAQVLTLPVRARLAAPERLQALLTPLLKRG
jgi:tetraacyldisaccharide 4'-kinase